jgi:S-adenosylmethionine decarboxylase
LKPITHLGYQKTIDFYGCDTTKINSCKFIESTLLKAAHLMDLTVVNATIHEFSPIGISGVVVIEESHIAIHTWPEYDYVAIDIFTCNDAYDLDKGILFLKESFGAQRLEEQNISRGDFKEINSLKYGANGN